MSDHYVIVVEGDSSTNFSAYCPDVLGCITTGPTFEATVRSMQEALSAHLALIRSHGGLMPTSSTKLGDHLELSTEAVGVVEIEVPDAVLA